MFNSPYNLDKPITVSSSAFEDMAERFFNSLDRTFMNSDMTKVEYDDICRKFRAWEKSCHILHDYRLRD